ncbi:DUF1109 domain-containing protein [Paracoccus aerodenitrificans]|uniref:DUF1109 domain-containing protein n=1 Tax=Paracoccus aerodenitrificans TaxID=3017781 RepID=UPI0022F08663|nr:DUF1109 domain-containing protein [Paracoccus aerodenitrificans]WBU64941.1 DUF1109 domain-containing protein [Paracoccus aerodenitrificans]
MKTEELIAALAADPNINRPLTGMRMALGGLLSVVLLLGFWHLRADFPQVLSKPLVLAKFVLPLSVVLVAWRLKSRPYGLLLLWPLWLPVLAAAGLFLLTMPDEGLAAAILGSSWRTCLASIPFLALPIGVGAFVALRRIVVTAPERDGLIAGLTAGAFAAAIYALHCNEDAPAFYTVWYSAGILICGIVGRYTGRHVLGV